MNNNRWGSFPRWVGDTLITFKAGKDAGASMSALRVYLALSLVADFHSGEADVSWSDLQELTGLSRPMVRKGLAAAVAADWIAIDTSGHRHSYRLIKSNDENASFTQVPLLELKKALPKLPVRGFHALDSLKVYITLLSVRSRNSDRAAIGHRKIQARTGVQPGRICSAIDVLVNHGLVDVHMSESVEAIGHRHNMYSLIGFGSWTTSTTSAASTVAHTPIPVNPTQTF
jgi:hypothetical protein